MGYGHALAMRYEQKTLHNRGIQCDCSRNANFTRSSANFTWRWVELARCMAGWKVMKKLERWKLRLIGHKFVSCGVQEMKTVTDKIV